MGPYPERGKLLPNFALTASDGRRVQFTDFKNQRNVVLVFGPDVLLDEIARLHDRFLREEAQVVAVLRAGVEQAAQRRREHGWPFLVLADPDGAVHRRLGAEDGAAAYVTDRFGEVFWAARGELPAAAALLDWLEFVNRQCPECFPSEWPA